MKIGIFTECFHPVLNGVVVSIDTFTEELTKRGHEFVIITTKVSGDESKDDNVYHVNPIFPFKPKGGKYPIAAPQSVGYWVKKLAPLKLDIIHCQHLLSLGALGLKVAKRLGIPAILTYHTLLTEYIHYVPVVRHLGNLGEKWIIAKSRKYCNQYDAIVTPSLSMEKLLVDYGVKTPIHSIPTGINLDDFKDQYTKDEVIKKYNIPPEHVFLFLYVSRIGKEKNVYFIFKTMKELIKRRQDIHLLMVGGGDEFDEAKKYIADNGLIPYITLTGGLEKPETNKIFGGADAFVFASYTETQGIILPEAEASGLPVIAVDLMGPSNYIHNNEDGFLVPLNVGAFTDKMEYLVTHKSERLEMGKKAKLNAQSITAEICGGKLEKLYEETIANYHRPQS